MGIFKLNFNGLELMQRMPGIDIHKDILGTSNTRFIIPEHDVPVVPPAIITGQGFTLRWS